VAWAGQKDPSIEWENRFAHQCDICRFMYQSPQIKRVVREYYTIRRSWGTSYYGFCS
jgi:hypothetical protein